MTIALLIFQQSILLVFHHEENYLRLNCIKANSRLDWMPKLNLEQGLEWTTEWYKQYEQNNNMKDITEQQIEKFQKLP